ncbi:MAG: hypothetical protein ACXWZM_04860 [Solirubrobacterales bacterium]
MLVAEIVIHGFRLHMPSRARALLVAAAAACLLAGLSVVAWPGSADSAPLFKVVLGKTSSSPEPACPSKSRMIGGRTIVVKECQAVGKATIFQSLAGNEVKPYQVPFAGKIVAWSITLSKPTPKERKFFNDFYGSPSAARIAVLRKVKKRKKNPPIYRLVRQSPLEQLNGYFGQTPTFALEHPLNVIPGQMVAISLPTWAPNWAINLSDNNTWRSSRRSTRCADNEIKKYSHAQVRIGTKRQYGCYFANSRLLYTATLVKKPRNR